LASRAPPSDVLELMHRVDNSLTARPLAVSVVGDHRLWAKPIALQ
jgi:hypothetical protein